MTHLNDTTRISIGTHAFIEGPSDYLENISACLLGLLASLLAAPRRAERTVCAAFRRQAVREGFDAADIDYVLMSCTLLDDRDTRDDAA